MHEFRQKIRCKKLADTLNEGFFIIEIGVALGRWLLFKIARWLFVIFSTIYAEYRVFQRESKVALVWVNILLFL